MKNSLAIGEMENVALKTNISTHFSLDSWASFGLCVIRVDLCLYLLIPSFYISP